MRIADRTSMPIRDRIERNTHLAGDVNIGRSTLEKNKPTLLTNGEDKVTLTYTAKDVHDNAVAGLTVEWVTETPQTEGVNITLSDAREDGNGAYSVTLTGSSGVGEVSIMPQVNGENAVNDPATVTLKAVPDAVNSAFSLKNNKDSYDNGDTITLMASLKNSGGDVIRGMADTLNSDDVVMVDRDTTVKKTGWTEISPGEYEATYEAVYNADRNTNLQATLALEWTKTVAYSISEDADTMSGTITAGGKSDFGTDMKFPSTAFEGASFTLNDNNFPAGANNYTLKMICGASEENCANWVTANTDPSGAIVTFGADLSSSRNVKIIAKPKPGSGSSTVLKYEFTIQKWFKPDTPLTAFIDGLVESCEKAGGRAPLKADLGDGTGNRGHGSLWPEWALGILGHKLTAEKPNIWSISMNSEYYQVLDVEGFSISSGSYPAGTYGSVRSDWRSVSSSRVCVF